MRGGCQEEFPAGLQLQAARKFSEFCGWRIFFLH